MQSVEDTAAEDGVPACEVDQSDSAIDDLLETARAFARALGKSWCPPKFDSYICRFCNQEFGDDELEADVHILEHLSDQAAINANSQLKEACFLNYTS